MSHLSANTLDSFHNNLPVQLTSFIGREREIAEVKRLLTPTRIPAPAERGAQSARQGHTLPRSTGEGARLLTLTGAGGVGKTRLSLQVAAEVLDTFKDGVWFVELAPLGDPTLIPHTILSAIGLYEQAEQSLLALLGDYFRTRTALLILDNCEHLIAACAQVADTLLHAAPALNILATSREPLGIAGELAWYVPSLQLPTSKLQFPISELTQYEAVKLFIERASFAWPTFKVTEANAPVLAQICVRLDGIPLAIELAAAR
jgi:predicted ATPase